LEGRYEYDVFGAPYEGEMNRGMNLGYTGKPYDVVTGMYNYGYRDYQPEAARFTTVDPIRDGANWFAYVNNDPVNWIDPWGLSASDKRGPMEGIKDFFTGGFNWVTNNGEVKNTSDHIIIVNPEKKEMVELFPGDPPYKGPIDGVLDNNGNAYKGNHGAHVEVTNEGIKTSPATDMWDKIGNVFKSGEDYGHYPAGTTPPGVNDWYEQADRDFPGWRENGYPNDY
jgi:RHS repeat-associated protein